MTFLSSVKSPALVGLLLLVAFVSCDDELTTIGDRVIGSEPFFTGKKEYAVFAYNKRIEAVQTNKLPVYQLGIYDDPVYGRTEAQITSQLLLTTPNPIFGSFRPDREVADPENPAQIAENETVKEVFLYIPFLTRTATPPDTDRDGVPDSLDDEPTDGTNDSDGDNISNAEETANGTDPLDATSTEVTDENPANTFARRVDIDSIYGNREQEFTLKVQRSTFFLRDLDPATDFQDQQEYFSTQQFDPSFVSDLLYEDTQSISDREYVFRKTDDPNTDLDESLEVDRLQPGIRVELDSLFFQQNILDKEGSTELLSQTNFSEFLRGIHLSLTPNGQNDLLMLLDLARANITITYEYQRVDTNATLSDTSDDTVVTQEGTYVLNLLQISGQSVNGNAVNTFINNAYPQEILDDFGDDVEASRIYLKGGAGSYTEINLFDDDGDEVAAGIDEIRSNNWIINEANLVFYIDRATLDAMGVNNEGDDAPSREPFRLYLYNTETGLPLINFGTENTVSQDLFGSFLNYDGIIQEEDSKGIRYAVRITDHINNLVVREEDNVKLALTITPDITRLATLDAMVEGDNGLEEQNIPIASTLTPVGTILFGSNESVDEEVRLKLEIFYTEAN
ncbi:DUF4270 domain-containing protein [Flavobacteriaceae bacterium TP-CH-4]|uniref:DUF4270 domain-containing protein n=1 Tax=Pelagihabitans pacificus TaxID=2696054 RepID=A0A967ARQ8_9FLAO|nr:DUF4270 family protein [Pelagihabitans pacificus]NHF58777.1 DUF4270 domain-containing protein [Pelagihabitans pacificus]